MEENTENAVKKFDMGVKNDMDCARETYKLIFFLQAKKNSLYVSQAVIALSVVSLHQTLSIVILIWLPVAAILFVFGWLVISGAPRSEISGNYSETSFL